MPSIFELLSELSDVRPNRVAVTCADQRMTYRSLKDRTGQYAKLIRSLNLNRDNPILISAPANCESVAAIFGILQAGHFYTSFPDAISNTVYSQFLKKFGITFEICHKQKLPRAELMATNHIQLGNVECEGKSLSEEISNEIGYVLLTTGSTGYPKGVVMSQAAIVEDARRQKISLNLTYADTFALTYPLSASVSGCAIFGGILNGIPIHCAPNFRTPSHLAHWINYHGISVMDIDFATIRELSARKVVLPSMRIITPAGEPLTSMYLEKTRLIVSERCIVQNALASTETRLVFENQIEMGAKFTNPLIPVGAPAPNKRIQLVPIRENNPNVGNLLVENVNIFNGYWGQSSSTAHLHKPKSNLEAAFPTGDILHRVQEDQFICLGRSKDLVQSSNRIVSAIEIEAHLQELLSTVEIIVSSRTANEICISHTSSIDEKSVKSAIQDVSEILELGGIISVCNQIDELPILSNGKIDRVKLSFLD